jgi:NDP-sugar pyrophosphorylase family protein
MQAVILAGGLGTRLRDVTGVTLPKPMVPVNGKPFLLHLLQMLKRRGITNVLLLLGHGGELIERFALAQPVAGMTLRWSIEREPLGTGGALKYAQALLDPEFLLLYGDSYLDTSYRDAIETFRRAGTEAMAVVYRDAAGETDVPSNLALSADGRVLRYEKGGGAPDLAFIDAGVLLLRREVVRRIPEGTASLESQVFPKLIADGQFHAWQTPDRFYDIGTPRRLSQFAMRLTNR